MNQEKPITLEQLTKEYGNLNFFVKELKEVAQKIKDHEGNFDRNLDVRQIYYSKAYGYIKCLEDTNKISFSERISIFEELEDIYNPKSRKEGQA